MCHDPERAVVPARPHPACSCRGCDGELSARLAWDGHARAGDGARQPRLGVGGQSRWGASCPSSSCRRPTAPVSASARTIRTCRPHARLARLARPRASTALPSNFGSDWISLGSQAWSRRWRPARWRGRWTAWSGASRGHEDPA